MSKPMENTPLSTEHLDIPVFHLTPEAPSTDTPAFFVSMALTEMVMAQLCQKIEHGETHTVYLDAYRFDQIDTQWLSTLECIESVQLHLQAGPQLAVMVCSESGEQWVSPWLEFAPEFDFGLDDD